MLFLLATLAAPATTPPVVRTPEPATPPRCGSQVSYAKKKQLRAHPVHRLDEEPSASEYLAVQRTLGGCTVPVIVWTGIGR